jgi:hypothetical protein
MQAGPGTNVLQLRSMRYAKVSDRTSPCDHPLHQLGEALTSANVGIGEGDLLTGLMKKIG